MKRARVRGWRVVVAALLVTSSGCDETPLEDLGFSDVAPDLGPSLADIVPKLTVAPFAVDFGSCPLPAAPCVRQLELLNEGNGLLAITGLVLEGEPSFEVSGTAAGPLVPGETRGVEIGFRPTLLGLQEAILRVETQTLGPTLVSLEGRGTRLGPCRLEARPAALNFGELRQDETESLRLRVENRSPESTCVNVEAFLSDDSDEAFELEERPFPRGLAPGQSHALEVRVRPSTTGTFRAELRFRVLNPSSEASMLSVPLRGTVL